MNYHRFFCLPPTLQQLSRKNLEYQQQNQRWMLLQALVDAGSSLTDDIKKQILSSPDSRPASVINERVKVARYFPKIGPIINRFLSQLFASPAQFEGSKDKFWTEEFFPRGCLLPGDSDGRVSMTALLRAAMLQALTTGRAIAQVDTVAATALTRAEQRALKTNEPYAMLIPRADLWDWDTDNTGLKFAKLHKFRWVRDSWDATPIAQHDFTIYERSPDGRVLASRYQVQVGEKKASYDNGGNAGNLDALSDKDVEVAAVAGIEEKEVFNLKGKFEFPIVTLTLPPALWVADQLFDAQTSFFNQTAALEFGLIASNYSSMMVETNDIKDWNDRNGLQGEGYFIHIDPNNNERLSWLERPGGAFETTMQYREQISADIDQILQSVAIAAKDAITTPSGEAIRQAKRPEQILLLTYGAMIRDFAGAILKPAAIARGEDVQWKIDGYDDFDAIDLTQESNEFNQMQQTNIPSPTFTKEIQKAFVRDVAKEKEIRSDVLQKILSEIDKAPVQSNQNSGTPQEDAANEDEKNSSSLDGDTDANSEEQNGSSDDTDKLADSILSDPKVLKTLGL